jgi:hypothetical protein
VTDLIRGLLISTMIAELNTLLPVAFLGQVVYEYCIQQTLPIPSGNTFNFHLPFD